MSRDDNGARGGAVDVGDEAGCAQPMPISLRRWAR